MICISLPGIKPVVFQFNSNTDFVYMQSMSYLFTCRDSRSCRPAVRNIYIMHATVEHELLSLLQHHGIATIVAERTSSCNGTSAAPTSRTHHCEGLTSVWSSSTFPSAHRCCNIIHEDVHVAYDSTTARRNTIPGTSGR